MEYVTNKTGNKVFEVGNFSPMDIVLNNASFIKSCVHYYIRGYDLLGVKIASVSI